MDKANGPNLNFTNQHMRMSKMFWALQAVRPVRLTTTDGSSLDGKDEWVKAPPSMHVCDLSPMPSKDLFLVLRDFD